MSQELDERPDSLPALQARGIICFVHVMGTPDYKSNIQLIAKVSRKSEGFKNRDTPLGDTVLGISQASGVTWSARLGAPACSWALSLLQLSQPSRSTGVFGVHSILVSPSQWAVSPTLHLFFFLY